MVMRATFEMRANSCWLMPSLARVSRTMLPRGDFAGFAMLTGIRQTWGLVYLWLRYIIVYYCLVDCVSRLYRMQTGRDANSASSAAGSLCGNGVQPFWRVRSRMANTLLRPICRPVHTGLFQSKEYRELPEDGHARLLLLCLLIHPHGGSFHLPGLYNVGRESLREIASMPKKAFAKALADLRASGLLDADEDSRLFWVPCALRLVGPPGNPNVVKGYARSLGQLSPSRLVDVAVTTYLGYLKPFGSAFWEPFAKAFERVPEDSPSTPVKPFQSLSEKSAYIDEDRNEDRNSDVNLASKKLAPVSSSQVLSFVRESGWKEIGRDDVERWVHQADDLDAETFLEVAKRMHRRQNVRDPLSYMNGVLRQLRDRKTSGLQNQEDPSRLLEDGAEVTFDE